jgi:hypothetical protein
MADSPFFLEKVQLGGSDAMREWTGVEIHAERDRLEREAATVLGLMLFEYSRLDMELGLFLSWSNEGRSLDKLATAVADLGFSKRLDLLEKAVKKAFGDSPSTLSSYVIWLADAHSIRALRNDLVHGRWGVQTTQQKVVNVVGLPTSPDQKSTAYAIPDLKAILGSMRELRRRLQRLRDSSPI